MFDNLINEHKNYNFDKDSLDLLTYRELYELIKKVNECGNFKDDMVFLLLLTMNLDRDTIIPFISDFLKDSNSKLLKMILQCTFLLNNEIFSNKIYYHVKDLKDLRFWGYVYEAVFAGSKELESFRNENEVIIDKITTEYNKFIDSSSNGELKKSLLNQENIEYIGKNCSDEILNILFEFNLIYFENKFRYLLEACIENDNWNFLNQLIKLGDKEDYNVLIKEKLHDLIKCFILEIIPFIKEQSNIMKNDDFKRRNFDVFKSKSDELLNEIELLPNSVLDLKMIDRNINIFTYLLEFKITKKIQDIVKIDPYLSCFAMRYKIHLENLGNKFFEFAEILSRKHNCINESIDEEIIIKSLQTKKCFECFYNVKSIKNKLINTNKFINECISSKHEESLKFLISKHKDENGKLILDSNSKITLDDIIKIY